MKLLVFTGLIGLIAISSLAQMTKNMNSTAKLKEKVAMACRLTDREQIRRMNELHQTIFRKVDKTVERKTSYELIFQKPDSSLSSQLFEFIKFEQLCCPWLNFQLTFQPGDGPVSLKMGNSAETKEMVNLVMEIDKIEKFR